MGVRTRATLPAAQPALAIAIAIAIQIAGATTVGAAGTDTPSLPYRNGIAANGDCWQGTTPLICRYGWPGKSNYIHFRAVDQFSAQRSGWRTDANNAVNAWNTAPGPQFYSFTPFSPDTWIFLNYSFTGDHGLANNMYGLTWNCNKSNYCDSTGTVGMAIYWTDVYMNSSRLDFVPIDHALIRETFGHESGHGMGLAHNLNDNASLMYYTVNHVGSPNAHDTGIYPGCTSGGHGTGCIYGWGD